MYKLSAHYDVCKLSTREQRWQLIITEVINRYNNSQELLCKPPGYNFYNEVRGVWEIADKFELQIKLQVIYAPFPFTKIDYLLTILISK